MLRMTIAEALSRIWPSVGDPPQIQLDGLSALRGLRMGHSTGEHRPLYDRVD